MGVQSGKTKLTKTKPNQNRKSGLDLVKPYILNECYF